MKKISISICCFVGIAVHAQFTQGPYNPGTAATAVCAMTGGVVLAYAPANNIITSNNAYAMATHCGCCDDNTNCLNSTNFGFTIPAGATITGIIVEIEKFSDFGSNVQDNQLYLLKAGTYVGTNHANLWTPWAWTDTYSTYGSCTDLWGETWTPADINSANFGVVFATIDYTCGGNINSFIDHVRMTVCYDMALPVHLQEFKGEERNHSVHLNWKTVSETNNDHFLIERSENGIDYVPIGKVDGAGNSNSQLDYEFVDIHPFSNGGYYRLSQHDHNGTTEIFDPIFVAGVHSSSFALRASWTDDQIRLFTLSDCNREIKVSLHSISGEVIVENSFIFNEGIGEQTWLVPAVPKGIYLLKAAAVDGQDGLTEVIRMVK